MAFDAKFFFDVAHANQYLSQSVIRYKGNPIYVHEVTGGIRKKAHTLIINYTSIDEEMRDRQTAEATDPGFDFSPVPLGMINFQSNAYSPKAFCLYGSRIPKRMWKIGLTERNFSVTCVQARGMFRSSHVLTSKCLADTISGKYPSLEKAIDKVRNEVSNCTAFCRRFAVGDGNDLFYSGALDKIVGKVVSPKEIKLVKEFYYLSQLIEKEGIRCSF